LGRGSRRRRGRRTRARCAGGGVRVSWRRSWRLRRAGGVSPLMVGGIRGLTPPARPSLYGPAPALPSRRRAGKTTNRAAVPLAHRLLLRDPTLTQKVTAVIRARKVDAGTALSVVISDYQRLLERIPDPVLRGRMDDLRDVAHRILGHLALEAPAADPAHEL